MTLKRVIRLFYFAMDQYFSIPFFKNPTQICFVLVCGHYFHSAQIVSVVKSVIIAQGQKINI